MLFSMTKLLFLAFDVFRKLQYVPTAKSFVVYFIQKKVYF